VREAVAEKLIGKSRYDSYLKLLTELEEAEKDLY
jgi:putative ribosome biogenesis GTPase RsgA